MDSRRSGRSPGKKLFVPVYEVIRGNVHKLYYGMTLTSSTLVRLTRDADLYDRTDEVDYTTLFELCFLAVPELRDPAWVPLIPAALEDEDPNAIFSIIPAGDILVHHPYESFDASVERFIHAAADDPQTVSIKMLTASATIHRSLNR